jgi:putative oxidoreductase
MKKAPFLLGRAILGGFFLYNGINHLREAKAMAPYAESKGVPLPELAVKFAGIPLIIGGASLLLGVKPKVGTLSILGFLAGVSPVMHDFWRHDDPEKRQNEMINFMKNMALAGGTLALMGIDEPWEASVPAAQNKLARKVRKVGRKLAA